MAQPCPAGAVPSVVGLDPPATVRNLFCVNQGSPRAVMLQSHGSMNNVQIGTLETNDFFRLQYSWRRSNTWDPNWPFDHCVLVRDAAGNLQWGFVTDRNEAPPGFTPVENLHLFTQPWNGLTLRAFPTQHRPAILRNRSGAVIETLPIGTSIAVRAGIPAVMGQSWCTYWQVHAVLRMVSPVLAEWQWADLAGSTWGFIDTGLPFNRPNTSTIRTSLA